MKHFIDIINIKQIVYTISVSFVLFSCGSSKTEYDAMGIFEAIEITVSSEANGKIELLDIEEGSEVEAGQKVGLIDTTQLYLSKMQIIASDKVINSRLVDVDLQISALKKQIINLKNEYARFNSLLPSGSVTQKQVDDISAQIIILESQLQAQQQTLNSANQTLSNERLVGYVKISQINDQISMSIIKSPISGRVISKYAERGELAMPGKPLFKIADMDNMYLRVYFTSNQLHEIKLGEKVKVFADYGEDNITEYKGKITWISDKAEFTPKSIYTSNERANLVYAVKVSFKNDGYAKIGMYGGVKLFLDE